MFRLRRRGGRRTACRLPRAAGRKAVRGRVLPPLHQGERPFGGVSLEGRAHLPRARVCKAAEGGGKDRHRILPAAELCRICAGRYPPAQRQNASDPRAHGVHRPPRGGRRQVRRRSPQQKIRRAPPAAGGKEPAPSMRRRAGLSERKKVHFPLFSAFGRRGRPIAALRRLQEVIPAVLRKNRGVCKQK